MVSEGFDEIFLGGFEIWDLVKNGGFCLDFLDFCFCSLKRVLGFGPLVFGIWMCCRNEGHLFSLW